MTPFIFDIALKLFFIIVFVINALVIVNAIMSAKTLGGELGKGLKKIAAGTTFHVILIITLIALESGSRGSLSDNQVSLFFMFSGLFGSSLLILGYLQIYKISKKLKLF